MSQHRLRGTWEDDPAPLPFPGSVAGRFAGAGDQVPSHRLSHADAADASTDELIDSVEQELDRISLRFHELRDMLTPFGDEDPPPAA